MKKLFNLNFDYKPDGEELSHILNTVNEFAEKISMMFFSSEASQICINFPDATWILRKESPFMELLSNLEEDENSDDEDFPDADTCREEDDDETWDNEDELSFDSNTHWRN